MASTARLDELKKKFDENPRRYFAPLANEHRKSGDLDQAISLCRAHLPLQPAHISGHIVLAQALFEAGSVDESRDIFLAALGLDPENLIALRYLGDIARETNDVDTARSWYQRVLEVDPRNDEIVQMVRDLETPRPVVAELDVAPEPEAAAPTAVAPVPPTPVAEDPRYAPLSMENFEIGAKDHEQSDAASAVDLPMLDTADIDPFDLHPSASAESLFEVAADPASEDFFLTELSGVDAHEDVGEPGEAQSDNVWSTTPAEAPAAAPALAAETEAAAFDEGAFYVDEAPGVPAGANEPSSVHAPNAEEAATITASATPVVHAAPIDDEAFDAFEVPSAEATEVVHNAEAVQMAEGPHNADADGHRDSDHNAEAMALFADSDTAEPQLPAGAVDEAFGLEVMEFVPPSSGLPSAVGELTSAHELSSDADPLVGRNPELSSVEQASTPAAFVTETMAELYLQQGFRHEALAVYRELLARNPTDASLRERVEQIENGSMSSIGMATLSENVVDSALKRQAGRSSRTVRSFFASLASRRAPRSAGHEHEAADASPTVPEAFDVEQTDTSEAVAVSDLAQPSEPAAEIVQPDEPQRVAQLSAAETLASFDPFADTMEMPTEPSAMPDSVAPNATPAEASSGVPEIDYVAESFAPPTAEAEPTAAGRSLEDLFPDTPVTPRTEAAAQAFATAFGRDEPQGRPTRAASNELSLDHVFRGAPEGGPPADGGFSFDQFFSDSRPAGGGDVAAAPISAPHHGRGGPPNDAHDIEQFTAWLEGLKKK